MRWLLLDRIDEVIPGERAAGIKTFNLSEPLFQDHFPRFPVVPGVLILESMAQLAGKLIGYSVRLERGDWPWPIFTMADRVKFRKFVRPGEVITLESRFLSLREESAQMKNSARVGGKLVAQAEQTFVFNAVPLADEGDRIELEALERRALRMLWAGCPD